MYIILPVFPFLSYLTTFIFAPYWNGCIFKKNLFNHLEEEEEEEEGEGGGEEEEECSSVICSTPIVAVGLIHVAFVYKGTQVNV